MAAHTIALRDKLPGKSAEINGAGATPIANEAHFCEIRLELACICSVVDNHVLPTDLDEANLRLPVPIAIVAKPKAS